MNGAQRGKAARLVSQVVMRTKAVYLAIAGFIVALALGETYWGLLIGWIVVGLVAEFADRRLAEAERLLAEAAQR